MAHVVGEHVKVDWRFSVWVHGKLSRLKSPSYTTHPAKVGSRKEARARLPVQYRKDDRRGGGQEQEQHAAASHPWQRDFDDHVVRGLLFPPDARGFDSELD
jgi:hypothetical protein